MRSAQPIPEEDLHAFIDGELPSERADVVAAALEADPVLAARVAAFAADKAALSAEYRPVGEQAVPASWIARIEGATARLPVRRRLSPRAGWAIGLAASLALVVGGSTLLYQSNLYGRLDPGAGGSGTEGAEPGPKPHDRRGAGRCAVS